jgi:adenylate cyclase
LISGAGSTAGVAVTVTGARDRDNLRRRGDRDGAIPLLREVIDNLFHAEQLWSCIVTTAILVEMLLDRGADGDVAEAEAAIERLAAAPAHDGLAIRDIWLLRLRALLASARDDDVAYRDYRDRYS